MGSTLGELTSNQDEMQRALDVTGLFLLVTCPDSLSVSTELEIWLLDGSEEGSRGFLWSQSLTWLAEFGTW